MIQTVPLNIQLHANQMVVHRNPCRFKAIKAGKRWGKSKLAMFETVQDAGAKRGRYWYIAPTYGQAEDIAWRDLTIGQEGDKPPIIPPQYIKQKWQTKLMLELINGSVITLKGADNETTLRGSALDGAVFDERAYQPESIWPAIIRGQLASTKGKATFISSPHEKGRNHYTNFCEEAKRRMDAGDPNWAYYHFTIYDNPTLDRKEIDDIKNSVSDDVWNLEYMAEESLLGGLLFSEFDYSRNVADLDGEMFHSSVLAMDYGLNHPAANLLIRVNTAKKIIYIQDELVKAGETVDGICRLIKEKFSNAPDVGVIDPSAGKRDPFTKRTMIDEYRRCFAEFGGEWEYMGVTPGDKQSRGYEVVKMLMKRGVIKIHPRCKNLIYQLKTVTYETKVGEDATDALRYGATHVHDRIKGMNVLPNLEEKEEKVVLPPGVYSAKSGLFNKDRAPLSWAMNEYA